VFEPHATVWAEEPGSISGLWKQRLRWARGNVQVTLRYRKLWFRPQRGNRLGSVSFGLFWFGLFLEPVFMIVSSASLLTLYFASFPRAWLAFHALWIINAASFIFITGFALLIDPKIVRHTWRQAVMFPGAVNLSVIVYTCFPRLFRDAGHQFLAASHLSLAHGFSAGAILFIYAWAAGSMAVAYLAKAAEPHRFGRFLSPIVVYIVGYGSLLCACTFASYVKELRGAEMTWDKTEKTGKVVIPT
jgi:hypothetical protein